MGEDVHALRQRPSARAKVLKALGQEEAARAVPRAQDRRKDQRLLHDAQDVLAVLFRLGREFGGELRIDVAHDLGQQLHAAVGEGIGHVEVVGPGRIAVAHLDPRLQSVGRVCPLLDPGLLLRREVFLVLHRGASPVDDPIDGSLQPRQFLLEPLLVAREPIVLGHDPRKLQRPDLVGVLHARVQ